jgi:DNA polymerase
VHPRLIVCLGAAAALSLLGPSLRVTRRRGQIIEGEPAFLATVHPCSILRVTEPSQRQHEMAAFIEDLAVAARDPAA